jgi:methionine-R-sulfoxide reductase
MVKKIIKTEDEWKKILSPERYNVMRKRETEPAFSCTWQKLGEGTYYCAACDLPLFHSGAKFESDIGWPSYSSPVSPESIQERPDNSLGMSRTEIICARCESHLGHVFDDASAPGGKRYCINSLALVFKEIKT